MRVTISARVANRLPSQTVSVWACVRVYVCLCGVGDWLSVPANTQGEQRHMYAFQHKEEATHDNICDDGDNKAAGVLI